MILSNTIPIYLKNTTDEQMDFLEWKLKCIKCVKDIDFNNWQLDIDIESAKAFKLKELQEFTFKNFCKKMKLRKE